MQKKDTLASLFCTLRLKKLVIQYSDSWSENAIQNEPSSLLRNAV